MEVRVKVSSGIRIYLMGHSSGLEEAVELLNSLPETVRSTPGVALSIATIAAKAHEEKASWATRNLIDVAKAGHPIEHYKSIGFDPNSSELVCEFYDPDLFQSDRA